MFPCIPCVHVHLPPCNSPHRVLWKIGYNFLYIVRILPQHPPILQRPPQLSDDWRGWGGGAQPEVKVGTLGGHRGAGGRQGRRAQPHLPGQVFEFEPAVFHQRSENNGRRDGKTSAGARGGRAGSKAAWPGQSLHPPAAAEPAVHMGVLAVATGNAMPDS